MGTGGLSKGEWANIYACLRTCKKIEKAILFGSRTMYLFPPNSSIEIMLYGKNITSSDIEKINAFLKETMIPHNFDIILYDVNNSELKAHIDKYNIEIPFK